MNRAWTDGTRTRMRARTTILVAVVTAALLACVVSPSAAVSERSVATKAVAGRMLAAPRAEALVKHLPVRVVVRVPPETSRLRVHVGRRDVTARFRPAGGSLRVANLTRGDGLSYGPNRLVVLAERGGRRPVVEARSFVFARRDDGLVRLRIRPSPVTSLKVRVAGAPSIAPEHFGQPGAVARRLSAIRRERTVRLWLNGRQVTRVLDRSQVTRWTASLSATHGLRHGVNRLRILVAEPDRGRYAPLRRRFVVRRNRHLAAAGWDTATRPGVRVRLDGRRSRTIGGGRPRHSWRIVTKPRGSRAGLRRASAPRPLFTPDRPGRYVVGLTVTRRTKLGTASQATPSSTDRVTVVVGPASPLVPFKGLTHSNGRPGIQVGDTFYPNPSPNGTSTQWLTLDRATLTPTGNSWLDGTGSGDHGLGKLTSALSNEGLNQLVILSFPYEGPAPPVQQDQNDVFNGAMNTLGVGPIGANILQDHNKLAIVGVPHGGDGSGWYTHGGGNVDALTGWLMPDATVEASSGAPRFRLQPERPVFDTSSSSTPTTNTMTLHDQRLDAALPARATGGFQVTKLNPIDFTPVDRAVFATNGVADPVSALAAMATFLNAADAHRLSHVAVQSIGHVAPPALPHSPYEPDPGPAWWGHVGDALATYGANPHTFNKVDGKYAFLGGSWLDKDEVAESSSTVVLDPTASPPKYESGTLRGRASIRGDGLVKPVVADASDSFEFSLYDIAFRSPKPWPYTEAAGEPDADDYAMALAYITAMLPELKGWAPDLRRAYVGNDNLTYGDSKTDLSNLPYPGDGRTCAQGPGRDPENPGYTRKQFCNLSHQLQVEFDWLDATKTLFDAYEKALNRSGNQQLVDLHTIGEKIRTAVAPDNSAEIGWSVGAFIGNLISAGLVLDPEGAAALAAWEALVVVYELVRELVSGEGGVPVGDQVTTKVDDLSSEVASRLSDTANGLDRLRDVVISDYGRLKALGSVADGPGWRIDVPTTTSNLTTAANAFFSWELMPVAFRPWRLHATTSFGTPTTEGCNIPGFGHSFRGAPASSWLNWWGDADASPPVPVWALGKNHWTVSQYAYPPAELSDAIFLSTAQRGYGVHLDRFFWEQYKDPEGLNPVSCF